MAPAEGAEGLAAPRRHSVRGAPAADRRRGGRAPEAVQPDAVTRGGPGVGAAALALSTLLWLAVPAVGVVQVVADHFQPGNSWARPLIIALFFAVAVARMAVGAADRRGHRALPVLMAVALTLFGSGSMILALHPKLGFPSVAEVFFGAAYLCFTSFLILDTTGTVPWNLRGMLETGVVAGGIVTAAVFVLVTPLASQGKGSDFALLIALIYPLADVALITILLTQLATRRRPMDERSGLLLSGLLTLAIVDASLPLGLGNGGLAFTTSQDVVWGAALAALANGAARLPSRSTASQTGLGTPAAIASGLCAVLVLAVDVGPQTSFLTHWPAVLTMVLSLGLLVVSLRDARSAAEAKRLSRTDDLTGLGNRRAVLHRLAAAEGNRSTLLLLDLNGFKTVNDAFGHPEGDRLLVRVGQRLRQVVPAADLVARLGGDEFAVICSGSSRDEVTRTVESILAAMRQPLAVADLGLTVSVAIGIAAANPMRHDANDLLRRADVAMYRAKSAGGGYRWYDPQTDEFSSERLHLIEELRTGIGAGQLRAFFQPQVDAATGALVAVEALARWQHPKRGLLAPAQFLPHARVAGMMLPFSLEMVRLCIAQAARWAGAGVPLRMSLNVDPPELLSGAWAPALIAEIDSAGLDPALFTVELTEELLVSDPDRAADRIRELDAYGIEVSIDDYGTGYSGLAWLQNLPVRELKLAQPFVSQVLTDPRTRTIVESTVRLATQLNLRVVAEGVEDAATAAALGHMDVALLQGYLICRPMMGEALDAWRATRERAGVPGAQTIPAPAEPPMAGAAAPFLREDAR